MAKFKIGDRLKAKADYAGFTNPVVIGMDRKFYHVTILNGVATILKRVAEKNYEVVK